MSINYRKIRSQIGRQKDPSGKYFYRLFSTQEQLEDSIGAIMTYRTKRHLVNLIARLANEGRYNESLSQFTKHFALL